MPRGNKTNMGVSFPDLLINQPASTPPPLPIKTTTADSSLYSMPTSPATSAVMDVLRAGTDLMALTQHKSKNRTVSVSKRADARRVELKSDKTEVLIELTDFNIFSGSNKTAKKFLVLSLIKINEQALRNGNLTQDYISFPIKELVDNGFYKSARAAREGFTRGMDALTSLKVKGSVRKSKTKETTVETLEVLFTGYSREHGQCVVRINPRVDWAFFAQYFTVLPPYYFKLGNRPADLLYYIFYRARFFSKEIYQNKSFKISFRSLQQQLLLPSESETTNPARDITEQIVGENTLGAIEKAHAEAYKNDDLSIVPHYNPDAPISDILDNGYLEITLSGEFSRELSKLGQTTTNKIKSTQARKQAIKKEAAVRVMADKLKADAEQEG